MTELGVSSPPQNRAYGMPNGMVWNWYGVSRKLKVYINRVSPDFEGHKIPIGVSELKICF